MKELMLAKPILVAAVFVGADTVFGEASTVGAELFDDFIVWDAVEDGLADLVAEFFGESGNLAIALARTADG